MAERSLAELQRAALVRITEAVIRTRRREEELVAARDTALRETESRILGLRSAAAARLERADAAAQQAWSETHRAETERFDVAIAELETEQLAVTAQIEERSETRIAEAERAKHEAIWLAETVFEATSNQPHEKFEQHSKGVAGFGQEFDRLESEALAWIAACRMRPAPDPEVETSEPIGADEADRRAAEAAGTLPSKPELERSADAARASLASLRGFWVLRLFHSGLPVVLVLMAAALAGGIMAWHDGAMVGARTAIAAGAGALSGILVMAVIHAIARRAVQRIHLRQKEQTLYGRRAAERCTAEAAVLRDRQLAELAQRRDREIARANEVHGPLLEQIAQRRTRRLGEIGERYPAQLDRARRGRAETIASLAARREAALREARSRHDAELSEGEQRHAEAVRTANESFGRDWSELVAAWRHDVDHAWENLEQVRSVIELRFPAWSDSFWERFECAGEFPPAIPFGRYAVDLESLEGGLPRHADLGLRGPVRFEIPALLDFPEQASLLVRGSGAGLEAAVPLLQVVMFRLLTALPPAKVRFTIIDPVGLGQNFAGFMHLADDDGALVTDRIWTEDRHIDQRLLDLTEHMENVIQKYLRNEYETIGQYNIDAGEVAEPYRFLVIANLPVNFSEGASRRLMSVASSGPRCGVFTLVTADTRAASPPGLQMDDLARGATALRVVAGAASGAGAAVEPARSSAAERPRFEGEDPAFARWPLTLDAPPSEALVTPVLKIVGRESKQASRVEVPFRMIAPPGPAPVLAEPSRPSGLSGLSGGGAVDSSDGAPHERRPAMATVEDGGMAGSAAIGGEMLWWSRGSAGELRVPLGRSGATKLQELALGKGVSQHVLIAGKTGSGKSTLLHALITNIALWYPPDEVEFYLVDFKKGVEFKTYAANDLPHARAVAIESDREFGLSVLQRLDAELRRRGETYRALGVQDLAGYRRATADDPAAERFPRTLLVIDEFQEFFTEDDKIAQDATLLLDRLVRQGRAFGIHIILGSQTLGGAYSLARSTIGQMAVRVALQCSESDSYLILSDDNSAARLLSRPGEAIYNDQGGLVEGNNPFQIAWLDDDHRDAYLERVRGLAAARGVGRREPLIVFEGNVPAELDRNMELVAALKGPGTTGLNGAGGAGRGARSGVARPGDRPSAPTTPLRAWLGDAIAIKEPTAAIFRRQSGANVLIVGQRDDAAIGMLASAALGVLAQRPAARVYLFDGLPSDAPEAGQLGQLGDLIPGGARVVAWRDVAEAIGEIHAELLRRQGDDAGDAPPIVLAIAGLARYRMLRQEDDFGFSGDADAPPSTEKQFGALLREGPLVGIHTIAWVDTFNNLGRALDRQSMKEFEQRVLFQMGQSDSSSLIDSPAASRLGLHRALFFSEEAGALEKFRPYAMPDRPWLERACAAIRSARATVEGTDVTLSPSGRRDPND